MYKSLITILIIFCASLHLSAQGDWILKKEKDGIQVYYRDYDGSKIRELKIELMIQHDFQGVVDALNDVEACPEWVYACGSVDVLEANGINSILYYTTIDFPWPLQDRDAFIKSENSYTPTTYLSTSSGIIDYEPKKDKLVRIPEIDIEWFAEDRGENQVFVRYTLHSDPGGIIPAWAINMALDKGPIQSMKAFKEFLKK